MQELWHKFINDKNGNAVLWQRPNLPIILWFVFGLVGRFVHVAPWHSLASIISVVSLAVWAIMEIFWGASHFRRTLGALVVVFSLLSRVLG